MFSLTFIGINYMTGKKPILWPVLAGNALEFFDLGLYGCLSPLLASKFFPSSDLFAQTIAAASLFAAGFVTRPLGAIIFGHIADQYGRKRSLTLTLAIMGVATLSVSFLPTYGDIGILAPVLLTILRFIQGICAGGEYNSAAVFVLEHIERKRRGIVSGIITATSIFGFFMASIITNLTTVSLPGDWSWRVPFLIGSFIALISYILRLKTMETPEFLKTKSSRKFIVSSSFIDVVKNRRAMISTIGIGCLAGVLSLTIVGFLPTFLLSFGSVPPGYEKFFSQFCLFLYFILLPVFGLLSDYITQKKLMIFSSVTSFFISFPIFLLLLSSHLSNVVIGTFLLASLAASFLGPMHAYMLSVFPINQRCRGISMGFSIGVAIFGGSAPLISTSLIKMTGLAYAPAFYFAFSSLMGLMAVCLRHPEDETATEKELAQTSGPVAVKA